MWCYSQYTVLEQWKFTDSVKEWINALRMYVLNCVMKLLLK